MNRLQYQYFYERNLPHFQPPGATLFITFRLAGSLPKQAILQLEELVRYKTKYMGDPSHPKQSSQKNIQDEIFLTMDSALDSNNQSPMWLTDPAIAEIVLKALHFQDGILYALDAYSIMPNHVHLVCTPIEKDGEYHSIAKILHSIKGFTAWKANKHLDRKGDFWHHESYDHVVRDAEDYNRIVAYVINNPEKAGLPNRWIYQREEFD